MNRTNILTLCTFMQGAATFLMCFLFDYPYALLFMRCFNGISLSGLTPIAFSIVADRFDDSIRGRMFALMNMSKGLGNTLASFAYIRVSEWCVAEDNYGQCP